MNVFLIGTTSHAVKESASSLMLLGVERLLRSMRCTTQAVNANDLHIVQNLSCYASGGSNCASPKAGKYRCWAHYNSLQNPAEYGGVDEMPVIYDGISWADIVIFATSTRWMSHSAIMQTIIERLNTLENRHSVYGEENPLYGKRCGVIVTGQHYQSQNVASHLLDVFRTMGFSASAEAMLVWQQTLDPSQEQGESSNRPAVLQYLSTDTGLAQLKSFVAALGL